MSRPLVGVTGGDTSLPIAWWFIRWALWRSGAQACRLTPQRPRSAAPLAGIVISGGDDIDERLYMPDAPDTAPLDFERDEFEIHTINEALAQDLPLLGICRGAQLLNVVLGGSLHTDIRPMREITSNRRTPFASKQLLVEPDTRLANLLGTESARINSLHHQAVERLGEGLQVSGRDRDGIIQAIEHPQRRYLLGVQWHPEYLPARAVHLRLFRELVASVTGSR